MSKIGTILGGILVLCCACDTPDWGPSKLADGVRSAKVERLNQGRQVYANYCAGCHGENGDGKGVAARFLNPKPRDFTVGRLKFAAVEAGNAARDEDYLRVIDHGLSGTAMPRFELLPHDEKRAVVEYIKAFYPGWSDDPPGAAIAIGQDPWIDDRQGGIDEGRNVYHGLAKCWSCHPAYETRSKIADIHAEADLPAPALRPNLYESESKESQWGADIRAPDFLRDRIKTGFAVENLARVVASGIGGTAMPTWAGSLEEEQIWGLAYYVNSLALRRETAEARAMLSELAKSGPAKSN